MIPSKRERFIREYRPRDPEEAEEYDRRHRHYDEVGEEYQGQRWDGAGQSAPLSDEFRPFYEEEE